DLERPDHSFKLAEVDRLDKVAVRAGAVGPGPIDLGAGCRKDDNWYCLQDCVGLHFLEDFMATLAREVQIQEDNIGAGRARVSAGGPEVLHRFLTVTDATHSA